MPDFQWKQGDSAPAFVQTLTFADGSLVPLQGATVTFGMRSLTSSSALTLTGQASALNTTGTVTYVPSTADTSSPSGDYAAEFYVVFPDTTRMTFPTDGFLWGRIEPSVATAPTLIVSLPEVKDHLGIKSTNRTLDAKLMGICQAIVPLIEEVVGPVAPRNFEEWHDGGCDLIELYSRPSSAFGMSPVMTLVAASEFRGPVEYPLSIVQNPAFGSIYSVFLDAQMGTLTRRSTGGSTIPFFPGRNAVHVIYQAGQAVVPFNVAFAAKEAIRVAYEWTQPTGTGSRTIADGMVITPNLQSQLTPLIRAIVGVSRRAPGWA